jgi:SAM-dependent methyltransferase
MTNKDHSSLRKLNLGCGKDIREGWVNLDISPIPGVDIVHNIEKLPLPFPDNSFDEILCHDILEHIHYIPVLRDIYRILAPGGILQVRIPHFTSKNNAVDPTHIRTFSVETLDFFVVDTYTRKRAGHYMFDFAFSRAARGPYVDFERSTRLYWYNRFIEKWVNKSRRRQRIYESTVLSRLFPAQNILITLVK